MCKYKDEGTRSRPLNVLCNFWLQRPGSCDSTQEALQDVDDWDLTELNTDWDVGESGDDVPSLVRHLIKSLRVFDLKHFVDPDLIL